MAAMYRVRFNDGESLIVYSADAKNLTRQALRVALNKARKKAEARKRKTTPRARATEVHCVG